MRCRCRTPVQILAHINDLIDWALSQVEGAVKWPDSTVQPWDQEVTRFYHAIQKLDDRIAAGPASGISADRNFQRPSPTPSRTPASWPCCGALLASRFAERVISWRRSSSDV